MELDDMITSTILDVIESGEYYTTTDVLERVEREIPDVQVSRAIIMYRLTMLRAGGRIRGRMVGEKKGPWIWWKKRSRKKKNEDR